MSTHNNQHKFIPDPYTLAGMLTIYAMPLDSDSITTKAIADVHGFHVDYLILNEDYDLRELHEVAPSARTFPQILLDGFLIGDGHDFVDFLNDNFSDEQYYY